ncbi:MAG: glycosyltransferase family 2 protein [Bacteroidota bacterium]
MIYFLIPIFNEEDNIEKLGKELSALRLHDEVFFVFSDDGSTDKSKPCIQQSFRDRHYVILGDGINRGPGAAFNTGFNWILSTSKNEHDCVVTIEADGTSDLGILNTMLTLNTLGYELVLASVYAQGGGFDRTSFIRKFISALANFIFRFLFDVKVLTLSSFYRVYSISLLRKMQEIYKTSIISEPGFVCMLQVLVRAIQCEAHIIEVPMKLHSSKRVGKSKMKIVKTTYQYFRFLLNNKFIKS